MSSQLGRLTWLQLIGLSSPALVIGGMEFSLRIYMPAFLSEHIGLPLATVGTILLISRLWDMVSDPLIGAFGDGVSTPIGRRRPWILLGMPLAIAAISLLYFASPGLSMWSVLACMILLYTGWTLIIVPHGAWGVELSSEYHERSRIFSVKMVAGALSLPFFAFGPAILERVYGAGLSDQISLMGGTLIIGLLITIALLFFTVPEARLPAPSLSLKSILDSFTIILTQRKFTLISIVYFCIAFADAMTSASLLFFVRDALGLPDWIATVLILQAMIGILSVLFWLRVSKKFLKFRTLQIIIAGNVVLSFIPFFLPEGNLALFVSYIVAKGLLWGADYALLRSIVADLVEEDTAQSGSARAGTFYASFNLTVKLATAMGAAFTLWILAFSGMNSDNTGGALLPLNLVLRIVSGLPVIIAGLVSLLILRRLADRRQEAQHIT